MTPDHPLSFAMGCAHGGTPSFPAEGGFEDQAARETAATMAAASAVALHAAAMRTLAATVAAGDVAEGADPSGSAKRPGGRRL